MDALANIRASMHETQKLISDFDLHVVELNWCAFRDDDHPPSLKPTRIATSASWVQAVQGTCPGGHEHAPPLRGARAKAAAAYPMAYCSALASSYEAYLSLT